MALVVFTLAWMGPLLHFSAVSHVECATHGVLEHGDHHHPVVEDPATPSDETLPVALRSEDATEHGGHDACQWTWSRPTRLTAWEVPQPPGAVVDDVVPTMSVDTRGIDRVDLLRRAPKTSPPPS